MPASDTGKQKEPLASAAEISEIALPDVRPGRGSPESGEISGKELADDDVQNSTGVSPSKKRGAERCVHMLLQKTK